MRPEEPPLEGMSKCCYESRHDPYTHGESCAYEQFNEKTLTYFCKKEEEKKMHMTIEELLEHPPTELNPAQLTPNRANVYSLEVIYASAVAIVYRLPGRGQYSYAYDTIEEINNFLKDYMSNKSKEEKSIFAEGQLDLSAVPEEMQISMIHRKDRIIKDLRAEIEDYKEGKKRLQADYEELVRKCESIRSSTIAPSKEIDALRTRGHKLELAGEEITKLQEKIKALNYAIDLGTGRFEEKCKESDMYKQGLEKALNGLSDIDMIIKKLGQNDPLSQRN